MNEANIAIGHFNANMRSVNDSILVYKYLSEHARSFDTSMFLRSQYMLIVSALDTFVHEVIINMIVDAFFGCNKNDDIECDFSFDLIMALRDKSEFEQRNLLLAFLIEKFSKDSFQSPKNIEFAFHIIGQNKIWQSVAPFMERPAQDVKDQLALIVKRRNQIAHESDWDKMNCTYNPISLSDIEVCKEFIEKLVTSLLNVVNISS